ncbi:hypothetical protein PR048_031091 [Dryococelus australis]|uniref:Uncharacterized protein n=1 Tax=Dryococelus australis TaxID=614101 RepID=A0ABQ9G4A2_9NEOP|nr:hypothetical protein PR048_031091 [Dryococelus australis]
MAYKVRHGLKRREQYQAYIAAKQLPALPPLRLGTAGPIHTSGAESRPPRITASEWGKPSTTECDQPSTTQDDGVKRCPSPGGTDGHDRRAAQGSWSECGLEVGAQSSMTSQSMRAASVPPTVTTYLSLKKKRAAATCILYTFSSWYSALAVRHGYLQHTPLVNQHLQLRWDEVFQGPLGGRAASTGTIPMCENPGVTRPGIEPDLPLWEASRLVA